MTQMISFLVAMDKNRVIGYNNDLPWRLPLDLKFFREVTTGHTIIMGRKTFDSIGRVLPKRKNVVLTRKEKEFPEGVHVIRDIETIYKWNDASPQEELFVIGGSEIFKQVFPHADRMYITYIDEVFVGDTFFPIFNEEEWSLTKKEKGIKNKENPYDYYFLQYDRKS